MALTQICVGWAERIAVSPVYHHTHSTTEGMSLFIKLLKNDVLILFGPFSTRSALWSDVGRSANVGLDQVLAPACEALVCCQREHEELQCLASHRSCVGLQWFVLWAWLLAGIFAALVQVLGVNDSGLRGFA